MADAELFLIKTEPEHRLLREYIEDNPRPPCPLVGLDHITEFRHSDPVTKPYYHCSLPGCCHEQEWFNNLIILWFEDWKVEIKRDY